tara:strand:+ start:435 stop:779 length:345 start_codon:yes stop_codon:yes gene_type:complete
MYGQLLPPDKQSHMLGGALGGTIGYELVYEKTKNENKALLGAIAGAIIIGTLKESYDSTRPNNKFDKNDLIATIGGGIIIGLTINLIKKKDEKIIINIITNKRKRKRSILKRNF